MPAHHVVDGFHDGQHFLGSEVRLSPLRGGERGPREGRHPRTGAPHGSQPLSEWEGPIRSAQGPLPTLQEKLETAFYMHSLKM